MKAGCGKTARPVWAADGGQPDSGASSDPTPTKSSNNEELMEAKSTREPTLGTKAETLETDKAFSTADVACETPSAETVEGRHVTKGNPQQRLTLRTQSRVGVSHQLEWIRREAKQDTSVSCPAIRSADPR